jgi:hypothetical protein
MAILNIVTSVTGLVGVTPRIVYIETNDTLATVTTAGYLNKAQQEGASFKESDMALVTIKSSPSATSVQVAWLEISYSSGNWSLVAASSTTPLASGNILVGNASGVATGVAMSGDATMANTGALTIANSAITNAKVSASAAIAFSKLAALTSTNILVGNGSNVATAVAMSGDATLANTGAITIANGAVTKAKLATAIQPAAVVKIANKHTEAGGSATVTITATGVVATDLVFAAIESSANAVAIQKITPTADTITVLCSGDPGASVFAWQSLTLTP